MTEKLFVEIALAVISIISALVSAYFVPYLRSRFSAEQLAIFERYVERAVRCAEQIFTPEEWEQKKEYVLEYSKGIINNLVKINLTDEQINTIIEGIVNEVKKGE